MIEFLCGVLVGEMIGLYFLLRMRKEANYAWSRVEFWRSTAVGLVHFFGRMVEADTDLAEFKQTAADIASLPEVDQ